MTHNYKRCGTTTRLAGLNVLDGQVISQYQPRHRRVDWLRFLKQINSQRQKDKALHLIPDNYATHKHPKVQARLAQYPRITMHFTPASAPWLNIMKGPLSRHQ